MSALVGGGPEMNKFEQVSSDGHQIALGVGPGLGGTMSGLGGGWASPVRSHDVQGRGEGGGGVGWWLYSEVQYIIDNDHMGPPCGLNDEQTRRQE